MILSDENYFSKEMSLKYMGVSQYKSLDSANKNTATNSDGVKYSINENFESEYDAWDKESKGGYFRVGTTFEALESVGINPSNIYWDKNKIIDIKNKHGDMTDDVIKKVPTILENPIIIMQSLTVTNRVVATGELISDKGPVIVALELKPNGSIENFVKIASAYGREVQNLINKSDILYIDPNKNRTNDWLQTLRLQLPVGVTNYGSIGRVTYVDKNVNNEISFGESNAKSVIELAFEKANQNSSTQNQYMQNPENNLSNGEKYSIPETEEFSNLTDQLQKGEISRESYDSKILELWNKAVKDSGAIKKGELSKVDASVPTSTDKKTKVSQFTRTVMETGYLTDEMLQDVKTEVIKDIQSYKPISNEKALEYAERAVKSGNGDKLWQKIVNGESGVTKEGIAVGERLLKMEADAGNTARTMELIAELSEVGTRSGQAVQAMSLLKRMTGVGQLYYVQRSIDTLNADLAKKYTDKAPIVKIRNSLAEQLVRAKKT